MASLGQSNIPVQPRRPKLLITHTAGGSLLRATEVHVVLRFENIGDILFTPKVDSITFSLPRSTHNFTQLPNLESLSHDNPIIHSLDVAPQEEGLGWLLVRVVDVTDGGRKDVECYQSRDSTFVLNEWLGPIYIRRPEDYRIIELLERIAGIRGGV